MRYRLDELKLRCDQSRGIDAHPPGRVEPALFVARRTNGADMGVRDLGQIVDRAGPVEFGRPEKPCRAAHLMFGNQTIRRASGPVVQADCRVGLLLIHHHYPLRPRKGVFHRRKPPAERSQLLFGEFIGGWRTRFFCRRSDHPHSQWEWHNVRLLRHFVPSTGLELHFRSYAPPNAAAPRRPQIASSLPFLANRKGERLPTTCRFETDTAHRPDSLRKYYSATV